MYKEVYYQKLAHVITAAKSHNPLSASSEIQKDESESLSSGEKVSQLSSQAWSCSPPPPLVCSGPPQTCQRSPTRKGKLLYSVSEKGCLVLLWS